MTVLPTCGRKVLVTRWVPDGVPNLGEFGFLLLHRFGSPLRLICLLYFFGVGQRQVENNDKGHVCVRDLLFVINYTWFKHMMTNV